MMIKKILTLCLIFTLAGCSNPNFAKDAQQTLNDNLNKDVEQFTMNGPFYGYVSDERNTYLISDEKVNLGHRGNYYGTIKRDGSILTQLTIDSKTKRILEGDELAIITNHPKTLESREVVQIGFIYKNNDALCISINDGYYQLKSTTD